MNFIQVFWHLTKRYVQSGEPHYEPATRGLYTKIIVRKIIQRSHQMGNKGLTLAEDGAIGIKQWPSFSINRSIENWAWRFLFSFRWNRRPSFEDRSIGKYLFSKCELTVKIFGFPINPKKLATLSTPILVRQILTRQQSTTRHVRVFGRIWARKRDTAGIKHCAS